MIAAQKALVIVAHPDDEVLGCGATIATLAAAGVEVNVAFLADGVGAREQRPQSLVARRAAASKACEILGVRQVYFGDAVDNQMDGVSLLTHVRVVEELLEKYTPDTVFTHHHGDVNVDHASCFKAVQTACRAQPDHVVKSIFTVEVPSSTEWILVQEESFVPNTFVCVEEHFDKKIAALEAYSIEMRPPPHPRSIEAVTALAIYRGASVGVPFAEAFCCKRQILCG